MAGQESATGTPLHNYLDGVIVHWNKYDAVMAALGEAGLTVHERNYFPDLWSGNIANKVIAQEDEVVGFVRLGPVKGENPQDFGIVLSPELRDTSEGAQILGMGYAPLHWIYGSNMPFYRHTH